MSRFARGLPLVSLLSLGLAAGTASAQTAAGFALDRFDPSERGSDWFVLDSLDLRGHVRPALGVVGDFGYKPLVVYDTSGSERTAVVKDQLFLHLGGSLVLWDRLRVAANLPILVYGNGSQGSIGTAAFPSPSSAAAGDLRLGADVRLLGEYGGVATLALGAQLYIPTGSQKGYAGDGKVRGVPHLALAGDVGPIAYAAKLGIELRPDAGSSYGSATGSDAQFAVSAGVRAVQHRLLVGPELFGSSVVGHSGSFFSKPATPVEAILGAHYAFVPSGVKAGVGAGGGLTRGYGAPEVRVVASLEWAPGIEAPPPKVEPPPDSDGDGILDRDDACPETPGVKTDDPTTNGCPPPKDRDKDGVLDKDDACPDEAGVETDDPKTNGCPPPKDRDKDGVLDDDDACIDEPGVKTDDPKTNGCPPPKDRDKDGVLDADDACPDEPGEKSEDPKRNGCPKAVITATEIKIFEQVKFKTGSAALLPESNPVLTAVLDILTSHTEVKRLRVEGHTDSHGGAAMNRKLSAARAASVVTWLVSHGVDKDRLTSQGFGPDRPIDTNSTEEGRQANRRVEFHLAEDKSQ
jgi:OOP family OmpA-OmpF porin